jgi:hypothetical protein
MAKTYRIRCPRCGNPVNLSASGACPQCSAPLSVDAPASISIYRMGNFYGAANGFGIYINEQPYGAIGNRETLTFPLPYGEYKIHVVCGMNRKCNDPVITLSESDTNVCLKVHMKAGFFQNSFILERVDPSTMPQN